MGQDSTAGGLSERRGLEMLVPDEAGRNAVHHVIYDELVHGRIEERSRALYRGSWVGWSIAARRPILLGCTEIGLLVHNDDAPVLIVDTTKIHASACRASRPRRYAWHQSPLPSLTDGVSGATFLDGP